MTFSRRVLVCLSAAMLGACAAPYPSQLRWEDGWRRARISEVGVRDVGLKKSFRDCRKHGEAKDFERFARASYQYSGPHRRFIIAPVAADTKMKQGDSVYVNIKDCALTAIASPP